MAAESGNPAAVDEEGRCVGIEPKRKPLPVGGVWWWWCGRVVAVKLWGAKGASDGILCGVFGGQSHHYEWGGTRWCGSIDPSADWSVGPTVR